MSFDLTVQAKLSSKENWDLRGRGPTSYQKPTEMETIYSQHSLEMRCIGHGTVLTFISFIYKTYSSKSILFILVRVLHSSHFGNEALMVGVLVFISPNNVILPTQLMI